MLAPTARGFLDRAIFVSGRSTLGSQGALRGAPSSANADAVSLKRGYEAVHKRFRR